MRRLAFALLLVLGAGTPVWAGLTFSTDSRSLFFGLMRLGETKELAQFGSYHHQVTCASSNRQTWYLKVQLFQPFSSGRDAIAPEHFRWQVTSTTGNGTLANSYQYAPFRLTPTLVYVSGANEAAGTSVTLRFKYSLKIPDNQVSGVYQTIVRFTLSEVL